MLRKILENSKVQTLVAVLILLASYIISSLQGCFGIILPFCLLGFYILVIILIYYVLTIPLVDIIKPKSITSNRVHSINMLKEYELTADIKEIWVITANLQLASDKSQFASVIRGNISRGVKYKFYVNSNSIAEERANEMINLYKVSNGLVEMYLLKDDLVFIDQNTDYDLFFARDSAENIGFIGVTIDNIREYMTMPQDLFIKLKLYLNSLNLTPLEYKSHSE